MFMSRGVFAAESSVVAEVRPSPNYGERSGGERADMILLQYTGMADAADALDRLCAPGSDVSAHYLVLEDGRVIQMVQESRRAWHAGTSFWASETDINSCSIGIEIANPGHDYGYPDFPKRQVAAVIVVLMMRHLTSFPRTVRCRLVCDQCSGQRSTNAWLPGHRLGCGCGAYAPF